MMTASSLLKGEECVISPSNGMQKLEPQRFAQIRKEMPPFLALHRKGRSVDLSVFSFDHDKWPSCMVYELRTTPIWMQTITGNNIINRFGRGWKVESVRHLKRLDLTTAGQGSHCIS